MPELPEVEIVKQSLSKNITHNCPFHLDYPSCLQRITDSDVTFQGNRHS